MTLPTSIKALLGSEIYNLDQPFPCAGQAAVSDGRVLVLIGLVCNMGPGPEGADQYWLSAVNRATFGPADWSELLIRSKERIEEAQEDLGERLASWKKAHERARCDHKSAVEHKRRILEELKGQRTREAWLARDRAKWHAARCLAEFRRLGSKPEIRLPSVEIEEGAGVHACARYVVKVDRALRAADTPAGCVRWAGPLEPVVVYSLESDPVALIMPVRL